MSTYTGLEIALANQVGRELYDYAAQQHGIISMLAAKDNMWGVTNRFSRVDNTAGSEIRVEFRKSLPVTTGVKAATGDLADLEQRDPQQGLSIVAGSIKYSYYQLREDIRKSSVWKFESDPKSVVPYLKTVAEACRESVMTQLANDLFPSSNLAPSLTGGANGAWAEDKLIAFAYPLQSGYASNSLTPDSTVYPYLVDDLNAAGYTGIKALNSGTVSSGFGAPTLSALRRKLLIPLKHKGAKTDLAVCDSDTYDYFLTQAEGKLQLKQMDKLEYGGEFIRYAGLDWMVEPRLDELTDAGNYRELYVLDSRDFEFRQRDAFKDFSVIQNPFTAALLTMLGFFECAFFCKHPRRQGRAFNLTV